MSNQTTGANAIQDPNKDNYLRAIPQGFPCLTDAIVNEVHQTSVSPIQQQQQQAISLTELRERFVIDLTEEQHPQPIAIEVLSKEFSAPIISYGAITLITAQAKSGKTFAHTLLVSTLVQMRIMMGLLQPKPHPDPNRTKVAVFDTEMSGYHVQLMGKRIERLTGLIDPANLEVWKLRTEANDIKSDIIFQVVSQDPTISAIVIDGVRDTIFDINSPEEAVKRVSSLLKWCEVYQIAIICILHQNKNDKNARGHIGTELKNKAEVVVNVERNKKSGLFSIEPEASRDREFEPIVFRIDETGLPVIVEDRVSQKESEGGSKKKLQPHQVPDLTHIELLRKAFAADKRPQWKNLVSNLKNELAQMGCDLGINLVEDFINYQISKGWVVKNGTKLKGERFNTYSFSNDESSG